MPATTVETVNAPCPTEAELALWYAKDREEKELARQSRAAAKAKEIIEKKMEAYIKAEQGKTGRTSFQRHGYILGTKEGNKYPAWRDEFEKAMGAAAAQKVIDATPNKVGITCVPAFTE